MVTFSEVEQKAIAEAKAIIARVGAAARAEIAKEAKWSAGHVWEIAAACLILGMLIGSSL